MYSTFLNLVNSFLGSHNSNFIEIYQHEHVKKLKKIGMINQFCSGANSSKRLLKVVNAVVNYSGISRFGLALEVIYCKFGLFNS